MLSQQHNQNNLSKTPHKESHIMLSQQHNQNNLSKTPHKESQNNTNNDQILYKYMVFLLNI